MVMNFFIRNLFNKQNFIIVVNLERRGKEKIFANSVRIRSNQQFWKFKKGYPRNELQVMNNPNPLKPKGGGKRRAQRYRPSTQQWRICKLLLKIIAYQFPPSQKRVVLSSLQGISIQVSLTLVPTSFLASFITCL